MKTAVRVVLFILALLLLVGLLCVLSTLTAIPWLSSFVAGLMKDYSWLPTVFAVCVLLCMAATVLALVLLVSVPTSRRLYIQKRSTGQIEITAHSIEAAAGHAVAGVAGVKRSQVRVKGSPSPGRVRLFIEVEPRDADAPFTQLGEAVQGQVTESLQASLAISPDDIRVRIRRAEYQKGTDGHGRGGNKVPRVI